MPVTPVENHVESVTFLFTTTEGKYNKSTEDEEYSLDTIFFKMVDIDAVLCSVTIVLGALSWAFVPKWRKFKNFAFVNLYLAHWLYTFMTSIYDIVEGKVWVYAVNVSFIALPIWQVLAAYSFYMDIVKIFSFHSSRMYVDSTVCAWILPIAAVFACGGDVDWEYIEYLEMASSTLNLLMYLRVVYVLMSSLKIRNTVTAVATCGRIRVATFIFVVSGVMTYVPFFIGDRIQKKEKDKIWPDLLVLIQILISNVLYLMLRSHRTLWLEVIRRHWSRYSSSNTNTSIVHYGSRRQ